MKSVKSLFLLLLLFCINSVNAMVYEFYFYIKNNAGEAQAISIVIYTYDYTSNSYVQLASGTSESSWGRYGADGPNAICNIIEVDPAHSDPNIIPNIHWYDTYIVRIGDKFVTLTYGGGADARFDYNTQSANLVVSDAMWNVLYHTNSWDDKSILLKNNFAGGGMYINSEWHSNIPLSGETVTREASTFPHEVTAIDNQQPSSYKMLWDKWSDNEGSLSRYLSSAQNFTETANFDKECNLTFQTNGKPFTADGGYFSSDAILYKRERLVFTAYASNTTYNDVDYTFLHWKKNDAIVSNSITVSEHATYVAWYTAKPNVNGRYLTSNSQIGQNVTITWSVHPNTNVTGYKVYRKVKINGVVGQETLLASISNRYTTSFTDYDYTITNDPSDDRLMYDVRPQYTDSQNSNVESDTTYVTIAFGIMEFSQNENVAENIMNGEIPNKYLISNYPNPFNPTTTINYQIPAPLNLPEGETSVLVTLKVYDILGKEIATLVNENKSAGYYKVDFEARKLSSGIYIYTIQAGTFVQSKKMLLLR